MSEKRRLGKGLGALIPEVMSGSGETSEVSLEKIEPNPFQPRQRFDDEKINELAASIKEHGVLQAVVLAPSTDNDRYFLVAGERRCRAARLAGLIKVPAVIKSYDSKQMLEIALIENLQREDLNPVEEARAYKKLMTEFNYTQEELARRIGKSRPSVANTIRLLSLPERVIEALEVGKITSGQARPLLGISNKEVQEKAFKKIIEEGLTARDAERLVSASSGKKQQENSNGQTKEEDPIQSELQLQMQRILGTKVRIKPGKSGGTIEIYYYGDEDLERLVDKLLPDGL
jgi:ParB family chromosome partitioning protein